MSSSYDYDVVVIGSGPGGYVAAIRAAQLKQKVALVEKDKIGGVCLNIGCIPSKSIISQADVFRSRLKLTAMGVKIDESDFDYENVFNASRKAADTLSKGVSYLLKKNNIEVITGTARLSSGHEVIINDERKVSAGAIIAATGSRPRELKGFEFDGERILSSDNALMLKKLPKSVLILGSGAIGAEFAHIFNAFGAEVHLVEMMERILPMEDGEITAILRRSFTKRGIKIYTSTKALSQKSTGDFIEVSLENQAGEQTSVSVEKVLAVTGRVPNSGGVGFEEIGVKTDKNGFVEIGDYGQTSVNSVYAIGDIVKSPLLAHVASKEGEVAAEHIAGHNPVHPRINLTEIPSAVYCEPQAASFGLTEEQALAKGVAFNKATFPYRGAGKAVAVEESEGLAKVMTDPSTKEIIGVHIIGGCATELIHEFLLARSAELLPADIASMIHAHPTLSEVVMEAARAAEGWAIHI
ncbi:MAG: dihydrolipoyl dehydrogenase [Chitinispirillales bacterium]|jgi:dihydrolipoamide dehydrogenase|nr:dihydrolipoyl dehydrogenase [Chitinispirillales bacterium]